MVVPPLISIAVKVEVCCYLVYYSILQFHFFLLQHTFIDLIALLLWLLILVLFFLNNFDPHGMNWLPRWTRQLHPEDMELDEGFNQSGPYPTLARFSSYMFVHLAFQTFWIYVYCFG